MSKKLRRLAAPVVETLESRQLLHAVVDLRVAGGGSQNVTVTSVGQVVNLELWVTVTGDDASGDNEGLQIVVGSALSSNVAGGSALGTLALTPAAPFNSAGTQNGRSADLDGDSDLDVGTNDFDDGSNFFAVRSGSMTTDGIVSGASKSFKIATGTFTVTSLLTGVQTNLNFRTRQGAYLFLEDGVGRAAENGGVISDGSSVILKRPGTATISGRVFNDKNANGIFDSADTGISGFRVFLDQDFDGVLDANEISKPVSATGTYTFSSVVAGTYRVREVFRSGWRQTFPALGYYQTTIGYGQAAKSLSFANTDTVLIKGKVWMDADKDRKLDAGEPGLANWMLYIDHNNSGTLDKGDDWTLSDANGNYRFFNLPAGTYIVRIVQQSKFTQTAPTGGFHTITLGAGQTTSNKNFGEKRLK